MQVTLHVAKRLVGSDGERIVAAHWPVDMGGDPVVGLEVYHSRPWTSKSPTARLETVKHAGDGVYVCTAQDETSDQPLRDLCWRHYRGGWQRTGFEASSVDPATGKWREVYEPTPHEQTPVAPPATPVDAGVTAESTA